jgi:hypothetical protein
MFGVTLVILEGLILRQLTFGTICTVVQGGMQHKGQRNTNALFQGLLHLACAADW